MYATTITVRQLWTRFRRRLSESVCLLAQCYRDTNGNAGLECALMAGGVALGGSGVAAVLGADLSSILAVLEFDPCQQMTNFCILR